MPIMSIPRKLCALVLLAASLAGCAGAPATRRTSEPAEPPPAPVNLSGYNATFRQGYADGCSSVGSGTRRDEARYKTEMDYQMGWNDGYSVCGKRR
jgi:hypothetical protein